MSRLRAAALSVVALTALGTLTACGDLHPGVALRIGDDSFSIQQVDDYSLDLCTVIQSDDQSKGTYSMAALRQGVLRSLAIRSVGEQLAALYDVQAGTSYNQALKGYGEKLTAVTATERDHALTVLTAPDYLKSILTQVGAIELANSGASSTDPDVAASKGNSVLQDWTKDHEVVVDPRFNLAIGPNGLEPVDTSTSFAFGEFAVAAGAEQPTAEFVAALPPSQRCG